MTSGAKVGLIHVVAAAVTDLEGRVLIAERPQGKHLAGGWEFPGGKIESCETRLQALARELNEELGITLTRHPRPLLRLRHTYPYGEVLLDMWVVTQYGGEPRGMDGQALRWCTREELETTELLPADRPVVRALRLPERLTTGETRDYAMRDGSAAVDEAPFHPPRLRGLWCSTAGEAIAARADGADFVAMREPLSEAQLATLCTKVDVPLYARDLDLAQAWLLGASGINEI